MDKLASLVLSGAVSGALYSLLAAGLVVSYTATGIFNFGYGAVAFSSAFVYFELHTGLGWPIVPAAFVTIVVFAPLLGLVLDRLIFRSLTRASESAKLMASVGVLVAVPALMKWIVELLINVGHVDLPLGNDVAVAAGIGPSPAYVWHWGNVAINSNQAIVLITAGLCALVLWWLLSHTFLGLRIRAVVDYPELAELRGVDRARTSTTAWVIGTSLAALAGVVGAPVFNSLDPNAYTLLMFVAVGAAVLGGLRSVPLAFAGGVALGISQNLVASYATFARSIPGLNASVPFVLMLIGLAVIGTGRRGRRVHSVEAPATLDYVGKAPTNRQKLYWLGAAVVLMGYLWFFAGPFWVSTFTRGLALSLVFLSFVVVTGMGGMVSLAQAAFVTASGLTAGLLIDHFHVPFLVGLAGGVLAAIVLGTVVCLPALRLGGLALALATLALGFIGDRTLFQWNWLRNAQQGWALSRPELGPISLDDDRAYALVLLLVVGAVAIAISNLQRSTSGRAMFALRGSEPAASMSGISPFGMKLRIFALSAALAGLGGVLLVTADKHASATTYPASVGLIWLATVVLWGVRRPAGAVIAGIVAALFPPLLSGGIQWPAWVPSFLSWNGTKSVWVASILFGLGAIQMARDPGGVMSAMSAASRERKRARSTSDLDVTIESAPPQQVGEPTAASLSAVATMGGRTDQAADVVLSLEGVRGGYGSINVLYDIDLRLARGTITVLLGANGAGKSTLCSVISGLLPTTAGSVEFDGKDMRDLGASQRARQGLVLVPESRGVFPHLTVEENLSLRLRTPGERDEAYDRFEILRERRDLDAGSLSGGEQQMLALAPILIRPPTVLIVDEPTFGLAPRIVAELMILFTELRDRGVSLLLVEEKARPILDVADDVAFLELGRIAWKSAREDIDVDQLTVAYLGATTQYADSTEHGGIR